MSEFSIRIDGDVPLGEAVDIISSAISERLEVFVHYNGISNKFNVFDSDDVILEALRGAQNR